MLMWPDTVGGNTDLWTMLDDGYGVVREAVTPLLY